METIEAEQNERETLSPGDILASRYEVVRPLGSGGMGCVYLAHDKVLGGEKVALKVLHSDYAREQKHTKRFLREVQLMHKVNHPNVVRTYDVGSQDGMIYFTMEYVPGRSLADQIDYHELKKESIPNMMLQIANGLAAIHSAGIIHRDLKPGNIILLEEGGVKITDFGVARPEVSKLTAPNEIIGSTAYMAPEVWLGKDLSTSIDLYSLGVILYELLTGEVPFDGNTPASVMRLHLDVAPVPPKDIDRNTPLWLNKLALKLLGKSPKQRPANAEEIIEYVKRHINHQWARNKNVSVERSPEVEAVSKDYISHLEEISERSLAAKEEAKRKRKELEAELAISGFRRKSSHLELVIPIKKALGSLDLRTRKILKALGPSANCFGLSLTCGVITLGILHYLASALFPLETLSSVLPGDSFRPEPTLNETPSLLAIATTGIPHALILLFTLAIPAALVGALSSSFSKALRAFYLTTAFHFICGFALMLNHFLPAAKQGYLSSYSLLSSASAAYEQIVHLALLSPFTVDFEKAMISKGLVIYPQGFVPLTESSIPTVMSICFIVLLSYIIRDCLLSNKKIPEKGYLFLSLGLLAMLFNEVQMIASGPGSARDLLGSFQLWSYPIHFPAFGPTAVICNWLYIYLAVLILSTLSRLKSKATKRKDV